MKKKLNYIIIFFILVILTVVILKYNSDKKVDDTIFKLKGSDVINLNINDTWNDPGVIYQYEGKDYSNDVSISGRVDVSNIGSYQIEYAIESGLKVIRQVNVLSANEKADLSITLKGNNPYYIINGGEYVELGANAFDDVDGSITNRIKIDGYVNTNENGTYDILYTVSDSNGITKTITRKVIVYSFAFEGSLKYNDYATNNEIIIKINDDKYNYTVLPSGIKTTEKVINYVVEENNIYYFLFFDTNNNSQIYSVEVNNIDKIKPTGSCVLSLYDVGGEIETKASDNVGVRSYKYYYGNKVSSTVNTSSYRITTMDESASVEIKDIAGNTSKINCSVVDKSSVIPSSYKSYKKDANNKIGYWLYLPKNNTKRQKKTLVIYLHGGGSHGDGTSQLSRVNDYAFPYFANHGIDMPFIMVAPQAPLDANFASSNMVKNVKLLIDKICQNYNVDKNKIIISGGSLGAKGVYAMVSNYKGTFAGALIVSGVLSTDVKMSEMTYLPVLYVHGISDSISVSSVEQRVKEINALGGRAQLIKASGDHDDITKTTLKEQRVFNWIINQSK